MAAKIDIISGTVLERDAAGIIRAVKRASVKPDISSSSDPETLINDATLDPGLPAIGTPFVTDSQCKLKRIRSQPWSHEGFFVDLFYERPNFGVLSGVAPHNSWKIISYRGGMVGTSASALPRGTGPALWEDTFYCGYIKPDEAEDPLDYFPRSDVTTKVQTIPIRRPVRVVTVAGIFDEADHALLVSAFACQGKVNTATIFDYDKGMWLCEEVNADDLGGNQGWTATARFVTLMNEDWSSWVFVSDQQNQPVKPYTEEISGQRYFLGAGSEYENSIRPTTDEERVTNGFLRIGPYELADFGTGFGNPVP